MTVLSRQERTAINETRLAIKRNRVMPTPTVWEATHRKSRICRVMAFENLNGAARLREGLLRGDFDEAGALTAKTWFRSALQKARRNDESARYAGCALHRM